MRLPGFLHVFDSTTPQSVKALFPIALLTLLMNSMGQPLSAAENLLAPNVLTAWCIVPFDPAKRGPEERAQMLERLGITRLAYDWRQEHIPTFDAEIEAMKRRNITISAWWYSKHQPDVLSAISRHGIHPQLWVCGVRTSTPPTLDSEVDRIRPFAHDAMTIGSQVGLYNHREPWFEDQDNQIAIIERLRQEGITNIGIVFNFHHWRGDLAKFPDLMKRMSPYLLAVNLNGMPVDTRSYPKVRFVGTDASELSMVRAVLDSGWRGPIGLLHERPSVDAERSLRLSLIGLNWLRNELAEPGSGGMKPTEDSLLALP